MKFNLKRTLLWVALGIFTFLYVSPLQAQVVRDHRTKKTDDKVRDHRTEKTDDKVRDHRTKNTAVTIKDVKDGTSNTLFLGEAGTFIGTRTSIIEKYPSFKFTGKVNRIKITEKLHDGDNLVYKMESGNALHAIVKKGKIIKYTWKDSQGNQISGGPGNDDLSGGSGDDVIRGGAGTDQFVARANQTTCYKCKEICVEDAFGRHPDGGDPCWIECEEVDCSDDQRTHSLPGPVVGKKK